MSYTLPENNAQCFVRLEVDSVAGPVGIVWTKVGIIACRMHHTPIYHYIALGY